MNNILNNNRSDEEDRQTATSDSCIIIENPEDAKNELSSGPIIHRIIEALEKGFKNCLKKRLGANKGRDLRIK